MATHDRLIAGERLALLNELRTYLDTLPANPYQFSADDLDTTITALEAYKARINAFTQLGEDVAFVLGRRVQRAIATIRTYRLRARLKERRRRDQYLKGNSTLLFLAEDYMGDGRQWPKLLMPNGIKYSTDLLSLTVVTIP